MNDGDDVYNLGDFARELLNYTLEKEKLELAVDKDNEIKRTSHFIRHPNGCGGVIHCLRNKNK